MEHYEIVTIIVPVFYLLTQVYNLLTMKIGFPLFRMQGIPLIGIRH